MFKHTINRFVRPFAWVLALGGLTSCTLDIPLEDHYSDPDAIVNVQNARSLLTAAYASYPHYELEFATLGPDFCPTSLIDNDITTRNLYNWQENSINKLSQSLWLDLYNVISTCDVLQERLPEVVVTTEDEERELKIVRAESVALEAMCYFNLLRIFGPAYDVNPDAEGVVLKNRVGIEFPKRSSLRECVALVRNMLTEAVEVYNEPSRNGWLSRTAIHYLLAELELYAGNYEEAALQAQEVLAQAESDFFTRSGIERLWSSGSCEERIFGFFVDAPQYVSLQFSYDPEDPENVNGDYLALSPEIAFDAEDYRREVSVFPLVMDGATRSLMGKYNRNNKTEKPYDYLNVMRYAGAYFIAAEACSHLEGRSAEGLSLINSYLEACQAAPLAGNLEGKALTAAVIREKLKEFAGEGTLYFDYKRLHNQSLPRWNTWGKGVEKEILADDYRWTFPIPASEYKNNENVNQNPGWPINR